LLAGVLFVVTLLGRRLALPPELSRKLVHISLGLYCLLFPLVFEQAWEVWATCALAIGVFAAARGRFRAQLGEGLHGVGRVSYGEVLFAVSVALLFQLRGGHFVLESQNRDPGYPVMLYVLPLLILTLCDAACALVGRRYGVATFRVESGIKTWEGVAVFIVTAWLLSLIALLLFSDIDRGQAVLIALIAALFGAVLEAASWRGLDNLFIPLGLYFILANLLPRGLDELLMICAAFVGITGVLLGVARWRGFDYHVVNSAAVLFFCIAIFSGPLSLITPLLAVGAYALVARDRARTEVPHDTLSLLVVIFALALAWFVLSDLLARNTIFAFNAAFAALAVALVAAFHARAGLTPWLLGATVAVAWTGAMVRVASDHRSLALDLLPSAAMTYAAMCFAVLASVGVAVVLLREWREHPWAKLGVASLLAGLVALPMSPG
jgi:dolichol kinase